jgi:lysosomal acid lipase/cholesteryl ester hydrolase
MAPMVDEIRSLFDALHIYEFLPRQDLMVKFGSHTCEKESPIRELCANVLFLLCGYDSAQFNRTLLTQITQYTPAGNGDIS